MAEQAKIVKMPGTPWASDMKMLTAYDVQDLTGMTYARTMRIMHKYGERNGKRYYITLAKLRRVIG